MRICYLPLFLAVAVTCLLPSRGQSDELADKLAKLPTSVLREGESLREMLSQDISERLKASNRRSTEAWLAIQDPDDWDTFRDEKIERLRSAMAVAPAETSSAPKIRVTGEIEEEGYVIRKLVYDRGAHPLITANLYAPAKLPAKAPGILLSHSHHSPKSQGELQDMGALWARAGCYVLVPDHLGHGERRQHPFVTASDYPDKYQVSRQDYHFRYNTAMQLYVAGDSLMGALAKDLMRGVDVLLAQPNIDPDRIAILGGVAGGGDPSAVTAALDPRIKVLVPFNFGGPQPETTYPLPADAEDRFHYAGGGSWESTRNLHRSAADGFLPWVIVGSVAPRAVIHAHEFLWDEPRDPVWKRYQQIFAFYDKSDRLGYTHGYGLLRQSEAEASHCGNIGKPHRQRIHEYFDKWWDIQVDESKPIVRHSASELACLIKEVAGDNTPLYKATRRIADRKSENFTASIKDKAAAEQTAALRAAWTAILGNVEPYEIAKIEKRGTEVVDGINAERWLCHGEREIRLPLVLLSKQERTAKVPVVLILCQSGKEAYLRERSSLIAQLLEHSDVCLVDLRGTGESRAGSDRGRRSEATSHAASELMLGDTLVGARLRDVRSVMRDLRANKRFSRVAVLGDSLAAVNASDTRIERPLELEQPKLAEPLGATLALLVGLYEDEPVSIAARGGLVEFASVFDSQFIHVPLDAVVPGAATIGDLPLVARFASQRQALWLGGLVDGHNRSADAASTTARYGKLAAADASDAAVGKWLAAAPAKK